MSFWDWAENAGEKLGNTLKKAGEVLWAGPGLAVDIARATADGPGGKTWGDALEKAADRYSGAADLLIDNGTITGWGVNQLAAGSEYVYRKEITPLVTQPATYVTHGLQTGDWDLENFDKAGEAIQTAGANGDDLTIGQSLSGLASTVYDASGLEGTAADYVAGALVRNSDTEFDPLQQKDWDDFQKGMAKDQRIMSNLGSGATDALATWYADPAYLALKPIGVLRQIRRDAPLTAEAASNVRKAMDRQADVTAKTYGLGKLKGVMKSDQADRVESVVGTFDEAGTYTPGYLRGLNSHQVYQAFPQLQEAPFGRQVATWLARTDKIEDDATRVGLQKDILAVSYGDLGALKNIQKLREEGQEFVTGLKSLPDEVDSALAGRVNGSTVGRAAEVAGITPAWGAEVSTVKEAKRRLANIPGAADMEPLFGSLQGKTLTTTAKGERALARSEGKGLLRDGTVNTGYAPLDAAGEALGVDKIGALANKVDSTLDELAGRVKSGKHSGSVYLLRNGLLSPAVQIVKKTAWDLPYQTAKFGYTASDKLRAKANPGLMNLFDTSHLTSVLDNEMRKVGMEDTARQKILTRMTEVAEGDSVTAKQIVEDAERGMFASLATKYGVREDYITELASQIQARRNKFFTSIQDQQAASFAPAGDHTGASVRLEDGTERALRADDFPTVVDDDGTILAVEPAPFWDTQRVHATSLTDFKELDHVLKRRGQTLRDLGDEWYETKRGRYGKKAYDLMFNPEGVDASHQVRAGLDSLQKFWKAGTLLRGGYTLRILGDDHLRMFSQGYGAAVWGRILKDGLPNAWGTRQGRLRTQLMAERETLRDRLDDLDQVAANKAEVDQLRKLNAKIERGKGTEDDIARRDMLMEQGGNLDIYDDEMRLVEVERMLREKDFSSLRDGKGMGQGRYKTATGLDLNDAYGGNEGMMSKAIVENSNVIDQGLKDTAGQAEEFNLKTGSWRDVAPSEKGHLDAWEHTINRQVRSSRLAQILLKGGSTDDVLRYLRTTKEGKDIARRMPHHASDKERWVANMEEVLDHLLPTQELRDLAVKRNVNKADLKQAVPVLESRPVVNGAIADLNLGSGQVSSNVNRAINKTFHFIAEIPTNAMSRHPLFITFYRKEADRLSALYKANKGPEGITLDDINRIEEQARKAADNRLRRTLFDTAAMSDAATTMRYLSPFFAAWQESMSRWGRLVADNPQVVRRFQMAFDAPRNLGLTVDEEGNLVKPGQFPEGNNRILLQLPYAWGGKDTSKAQNRTGLTVGESSFNLIFNGGGVLNPGFGPFAQIPTNVLTERMANSKDLEHLSKAISPYGPTQNVLDPLVPATVKRAATLHSAFAPWAKEHNAEFTMMEATILQEKVVDFQLAKGRAPSKTEQRKMEKEAESEAQRLAIWRFVNNAVSPAPANFQGKYEGLRQEYRRFQDEAQQNGKEIGWADEQFVKKYGPEFFALTRSRSNNPGQVAASNETIAGVKLYSDEMKLVDPKLYRMVLGDTNKQGFSTAAYRHLQNEGVISKKDGADAVSDALISQGWNEYRKYLSWANAKASEMGFKSYRDSDELSGFLRFAKDAIGKENPQWYQDLTDFNPSEFDSMLGDMRAVAGMKKLNSDPLRAAGQDALRTYLDARDRVAGELERRAAEGGASTIQAEANADLQGFLDFVVSSMIEQSIDFERYYYPGTVERDPWLSGEVETTSA